VEQAVRATATPIAQRKLRVRLLDTGASTEIPIDTGARSRRAAWSTYAAAVARRVARDFPGGSGGVDVAITSTLPSASGLSSSTALTIALTLAVVDATGVRADPLFQQHCATPLEFAEYVAAIETGAPYGPFPGDAGVGVRGGAQDHVAIMCARAGMVGRFSYMPAREEGYTTWPASHALVIGVSGVRASKTGNANAAYNRAADSLRWLVHEWNSVTRRNDATLAAALAAQPDAVERMESLAAVARDAPVDAPYLARRLRQFREECSFVVPQAEDALRALDLTRLGAVVDESQRMAEEALGNQVPETIHLARSARQLGAVAASAFGAGFGGAVWAMVDAGDAAAFAKRWKAAYAGRFAAMRHKSSFLITAPGSGVLASPR
jgi:galactokinase